MNRVKEVDRINKKDLQLQLASDTVGNAGKWDVNKSWHAQYKDSAYVYVGGLPTDVSEGDVIVIFSQFGEIVDVNMPREQKTGKPRGFAFIAFEDQRSTVLAVDNFNGAKLLGRTLRCDHCSSFHEEQKKDAANLPDHVVRKLSEKELEEKKRSIVARNEELDVAEAAKAELFSVVRGTAETEAEYEERRIRAQLGARKEADAQAKRQSHIDAVLARRRGTHAADAAAESRRAEEKAEWRRKKVAEEAAAAAAAEAKLNREPAPARELREGEAPAPKVSDDRWERMMGGGGKKKKRKHSHREKERDALARAGAGADAPREKGKMGEAAISVDETNALRESLGLKPLRS